MEVADWRYREGGDKAHASELRNVDGSIGGRAITDCLNGEGRALTTRGHVEEGWFRVIFRELAVRAKAKALQVADWLEDDFDCSCNEGNQHGRYCNCGGIPGHDRFSRTEHRASSRRVDSSFLRDWILSARRSRWQNHDAEALRKYIYDIIPRRETAA